MTEIFGVKEIKRCACPIWAQRWKPDTPEWCARCGGLLDPKTLGARRPRPGDPA